MDLRSPPGLWIMRLLLVAMLGLSLGALWNVAAGGSPAVESAPPSETAGAGHQPQLSTETQLLIASLFILVLAGFVGFEVIGGVSPLLHTPLMSVTNAISAISLVGSLVIAGSKDYDDAISRTLGLVAVTAASINVVGGFLITDRMLRMFKLKEGRR
jgi:H+-translocating NAD(P) transhydrogenase subunit alpha